MRAAGRLARTLLLRRARGLVLTRHAPPPPCARAAGAAKLSGALKTAQDVGLPVRDVLGGEAAPTAGTARASHPGSLPAFVAAWFGGPVPCIVRYALGGRVHWHVNAAAEDAWQLRLDRAAQALGARPAGGLYPEGDWLPSSEIFGAFLRLPEVQCVLAHLMSQIFAQMMAAGAAAAVDGRAGARHAAADVPLPLPLARRGRVLGTYQVRCRLVTEGEHSWAASVFLPPSLESPEPFPFALPPPSLPPPELTPSAAEMVAVDGISLGLCADVLELCGEDELLAIAGLQPDGLDQPASSNALSGRTCRLEAELERILFGHGTQRAGGEEPSGSVQYEQLADGILSAVAADVLEGGLDADLLRGDVDEYRPHSPRAHGCADRLQPQQQRLLST